MVVEMMKVINPQKIMIIMVPTFVVGVFLEGATT
jgi:hypothetical protein